MLRPGELIFINNQWRNAAAKQKYAGRLNAASAQSRFLPVSGSQSESPPGHVPYYLQSGIPNFTFPKWAFPKVGPNISQGGCPAGGVPKWVSGMSQSGCPTGYVYLRHAKKSHLDRWLSYPAFEISWLDDEWQLCPTGSVQTNPVSLAQELRRLGPLRNASSQNESRFRHPGQDVCLHNYWP